MCGIILHITERGYMKEDIKKQILKMKEEDLFLITYYAKKYGKMIT